MHLRKERREVINVREGEIAGREGFTHIPGDFLMDSVRYLRTLGAVRDRCAAVWALAVEGKTKHFALNPAKLPGNPFCACISVVSRYPRRSAHNDARFPLTQSWCRT
jgi:hypothetical protein